MKSQEQTSDAMRELIDVIKVHKEERVTKICQLLSSVKCATMSPVKGVKKKRPPTGNVEDRIQDDGENSSTSAPAKKTGRPLKYGISRERKLPKKLKKCCVRGCEETHFWTKKWNFCKNCKKSFCPSHINIFYHHKCKPFYFSRSHIMSKLLRKT